LSETPGIMKSYLYLFVLLAIGLNINGQSNFLKAIVINNNGDSIYGSINYRNWKNNPKTISFLNTENKTANFDAGSIKGFFIPSVNETYTSFAIEKDMLPQNENEAINNNNINSPSTKETAFLLQLVKHPLISLYLLVTDNKEHFYYRKENEVPVELIHHYLFNDSNKQLEEVNTYKKQLSDLFLSCPNVAAQAETTGFSEEKIQHIIVAYIQCVAPGSAVDNKKKDPTQFTFGIIAGAMLNKFRFEGSDELLVDNNYSGNVSPVLGISLDLGLSRNRNKWHIINEIIYKSYKTSSSFVRPYGNGYMLASDVSLGFSYAQINTLLRYVYQLGNSLMPYINAGLGNAFIVKENKNIDHKVYSFGTVEDGQAINSPRKYELTIQAGLGLVIRNVQFELRYGKSKKGFSPYQSLDTNPESFQFLFTYQLK
jgi:hypothetical protein